MSGSRLVPYDAISRPELLDVVDDDWRQDTLPNDGEKLQYLPGTF